jgi:hypothetical protein
MRIEDEMYAELEDMFAEQYHLKGELFDGNKAAI